MAESIINIKIQAKDDPTVNISVIEAGSVSGTSNLNPSIQYVATGGIGPTGNTGATGSVSAEDSVTQANMANNSVGTPEIIDGSVTHSKIANGAIYGNKILDDSVSGSKLSDGSISGDKLQNNSVDATKIADGAITQELLELGVISRDQIEDKSITAGQIANNTIVRDLYVDNSINGDKIEDNVTLGGTVTVNHLELEGSGSALIEGPAGDDINIKTHDQLNIQNTSGSTVASFDQSGNLSLSGTVDGIDIATDVAANTLKLGISTSQANEITANTAKVGITPSQASAITVNTSKVSFPGFGTTSGTALEGDTDLLQLGTSSTTALAGDTTTISISQASAITANTAKVGITTSQADAITANTAKPDLTVDGAGTVHANNYTNTTYSIQDGELSQNNFTDADHTKLDGIEASADVTDTANVTAAGALMDSELTDLAGVKGVTISTLQVKPSEGAFANGDKTKLDGIEVNATADQTQADINGLGITAIGIAGPTDGDVLISTDGSISVILDNDNDESNQYFEVRNSATGTVFSINENGTATFTGDVTVNERITNTGTDNDLTLESDGSMTFTIDRDNDETSQSFSFRNYNVEVANLDESGNLQIDGNLTLDGTVDGRDVAADGTKLDGIESGATADQTKADIDALGIAATTAVGLTSGDKTIEGNLRLGGTGDTSNNWISIDAQNGNDSSGGGITFYETGTYDVDSPQYGAKIVYNEDADEFAIGTMHNNVFMRQIYFIRGIARTYFNGDLQIRDSSPAITVVDTSTTVANGDVVGILNFSNEDDDGSTLRIQAVATEDHASGTNGGTKLEIKTTPNGSSTETVALTVGEDKSLTSPGLLTSMQRHLLRCGFYGNASRMYMPFNYGGTFESTSTAGYSEYGAVIMPCDGYVESVIIRSEQACGNSIVTVLVASNGTEVPTLSPGSFASPTVNMAADDTSYKFTGFVNQGGTTNSFSAGDVIMIAFDPTSSSYDTTATAVLVFDWNNQL